jgi:Leucine-rich repeat (LRR) protein
MENLRVLSIFCNQIDSLPSSIKNLQKLEVFNAGNNPRIYVPASFNELKSMKRMYWVNNKWNSLPMTFEKMTFVHDFYINGNDFSEEEKERVRKLFPNIRLNIDE